MFIGFTGHRDFTNVELARRWVDGIAIRHPGATIITGAAIGADLIVAEQVVRCNDLKSLVVLPMLPHIFTAKWNSELSSRLDFVLQNSDIYLVSEYREVSYNELCELDYACADYETSQYEIEFLTERNQHLIANSDFLVAFWDGRQEGGTFNAIQTALEEGVEIYQGFPRQLKQGNKIINSYSPIEKDEPLSDLFLTEEPCIEGYERLQAKIGYTNFSFYPLSSDRYASQGNVYERHDDFSISFREEPLAPSNSLIATLKATLNVDSENAKDFARMIEEIGIEHKDYFIQQFKKNPFSCLQELQFLSDGLADLQEDLEDVMSRINVENATLVQAWNDDPSEDTWEEDRAEILDDEFHVVNDPSTAWHRLDADESRTFIDPSLPLPPEPKNPIFDAIIEKARTRTSSAGKEIYALSKSGKVKLTYDEWNKVWEEYKGKRSPKFGASGLRHHVAYVLPGIGPSKLHADFNPQPVEPFDIDELKLIEPLMKKNKPVRYRVVNQKSEKARRAKRMLAKTEPKLIVFSQPYSFVRSEKVFHPAAFCINQKRQPRIIEIESMTVPKLFDVSNPARYPAMICVHA